MGRLHPARYIKEDDVMPLALSQSNPDVGSSPSFCSGRKLGDIEQALLWSLLQEDPQCPSRLLLDEAARRQRPIAVSLRQLNRWRVQWQLNRRQGRPRQTPYSGSPVSGAAVVRVRPSFLPPSLASSTSPSLIRASIRSPRCSVAAIKAPP